MTGTFDLSTAVIAAFIGSIAANVALVATRRHHGWLSLDDLAGVQKIHASAVPRVGGVGVAFGCAVALGFVPDAQTRMLWMQIMVAAAPAFAMGFAEDLTKRILPRWRLLATFVSGLIFALWTGYMLNQLGWGPVDTVLAVPVVAALFTAFAIGGVANAFNLIDGCNGLASGTAVILLGAFAAIAAGAGDWPLFSVTVAVMAAIAGFLVFNFPAGKVFLGDAGAYGLGVVLAAIAVALPARNAGISPTIGLLVLGYPVTETLFSIWRRLRNGDTGVGEPDAAHLHSLVFAVLPIFPDNRVLRNSATSVVLWSLPTLSAITAYLVPHGSFLLTLGLFAGNALIYLMAYFTARGIAANRPMPLVTGSMAAVDLEIAKDDVPVMLRHQPDVVMHPRNAAASLGARSVAAEAARELGGLSEPLRS